MFFSSLIQKEEQNQVAGDLVVLLQRNLNVVVWQKANVNSLKHSIDPWLQQEGIFAYL